MSSTNKLDNPVWHSLNEAQAAHALTYANLKCYHPDYCPFGGFTGGGTIPDQMDQYAGIARDFYIVGDKPLHSNSIYLKRELATLQMVLNEAIKIDIQEEIVKLNNHFRKELFDLVNLVQPGYFKDKTADLGEYFGIFKNDSLISVAGERMMMKDFTEVSAIVTHPDHSGKGYAKQLTAYTANRIFDKSKTPFLHVAAANTKAIGLYEKLGFHIRRKISFWNFEAVLSSENL